MSTRCAGSRWPTRGSTPTRHAGDAPPTDPATRPEPAPRPAGAHRRRTGDRPCRPDRAPDDPGARLSRLCTERDPVPPKNWRLSGDLQLEATLSHDCCYRPVAVQADMNSGRLPAPT